MSGLMRHGMARQSAQTTLQLSGAQYATPLHIDETPHSSYLVRSHLCTQQY